MKAARSNMLGAGISNNKVKYSRLAADDDGYIDLQVRHLFFLGNSINPMSSYAALQIVQEQSVNVLLPQLI